MLSIACPKCRKSYKVDPRLAGKTLKCKMCGAGITISAGAAPVVVTSAPAPVSSGSEAPRRPGAAAKAPASDRCPACGESLPAGEFICLSCGFHRELGEDLAGAEAPAPAAPPEPLAVPPRRISRSPAAPKATPVKIARSTTAPRAPAAPSAHMALLDSWGVTILFFLGIALVNYPWIYFLYRFATSSRPPLAPGEWKVPAVAFLVCVACTAFMAAAIWPLILGALKQAGAALKFDLPEDSFKRLIAVAALPLFAWGICDHLLFSNQVEHIFSVQLPKNGLHNITINLQAKSLTDLQDQVTTATYVCSAQAAALAAVIAAAAFFFFFRLRGKDFILCAVVFAVLLGGGLLADTFISQWSGRHIVSPLEDSVTEDLKNLPNDEKKAYLDKLQAYMVAQLQSSRNAAPTQSDPTQVSWQLPQ